MPSRPKSTKTAKAATKRAATKRATKASPTPAAPVAAPVTAPPARVGVEVVRSRLRDAAMASGESLAPEVVVPAITHQAPTETPTKAPKEPKARR